MSFIRIVSVPDFGDKNVRSFRILGRHVGVFRDTEGGFRAMEIGCRHQHADLTQGRMTGDIVTCPRHGWRYNLQTGACVHGSKEPLRHYSCKVENGHIYISAAPLAPGESPGAGESGAAGPMQAF